VSNRPLGSCNFLPLPPILAASGTAQSQSPEQHNDVPSLVTYRHYATLYFIVISTSTESPLALIDLIQVYVEALDKLFENVCELDLIFNFETLHSTLGEMIVGGVVIETSLERIVSGVRAQGTVAKRPVNESRSTGLGAGLGMGGNFIWPSR
jgi:AP-3 complex subunit sigma